MPNLSFTLCSRCLPVCVAVILICTLYTPLQSYAQSLPNVLKNDTLIKANANAFADSGKRLLTKPVKAINSAFSYSKNKFLGVAMTIESESRYQPLPAVGFNNSAFNNSKFISSVNLRGNLIVWGVPLVINYATNRNLGDNYSPLNDGLFKFDYNPSRLKELMSTDLDAYYTLRKKAFAGLSLTEYTHRDIIEKIQSNNKHGKINDDLISYLRNDENLASLYNLDDVSLRQKLLEIAQRDSALQFKNYLKEIKSDSLQSEGKEYISIIEDSLRYANNYQFLKDSLNAQVDTAVTVIATVRNSLIKQGYDINKIFQMQRLLKSPRGDLADAEIIQNYARVKALNSLQGLFSHFEALKIGAFSNKVPGNMNSADLFLTGAHLTYAISGVPVTIGYGGLNDVRTFKDASYQGSVYNTARTLTYISANVFRNSANDIKFSVVSAFSKNGRNNNDYFIPVVSENNVAVTISKQFKSQKAGSFLVDVSKSTTLYANNSQVGSEAIFARKEGVMENNAGNLFESLSFGINHQAQIKSIGLSDVLYFNYAGLGYQNPANNGFGGARMKIGGNIRKSFYRNRILLTVRTDIKNTPISYTSDDKWKTLQLQFDGRYQINKKATINLKYTTNGTDKKIDGVQTSVYNFKKLQVDGNLRYKIGKNYAVNHLILGYQAYGNSYATQGVGDMFMLNYTQSLIISKNVLTVTLFHNKELSPEKLIGNMTNAEISYQYPLFNVFTFTSGITYLDNGNIARQAGIRQGIQLLASSKFDIDTYLDLRKNMVTPRYTDMYASCRAEIMLRYHLTNK